MENTIENKARFFTQYWGQQILCCKIETSSHKYKKIGASSFPIDEYDYLELKPLSSITDEDAKKLGFKDSKRFLKSYSTLLHKDEIRIMGYAVEWCNLTVEGQVDYGWIKLKS